MSLYGADHPTTPAADAFAREAVTFTNAFSISTWTRPSVATLLTSQLPSSTATLNRWGRLDESVWYLPEAFQQRGWTTAAFVSNGNLFDDRTGFQRGMNLFRLIIHEPDGSWHATAREVVDPAVKFIEKQDSPRFFLFVHVVDPHTPYVLEPPYRELFSDRPASDSMAPVDYDRSVRQADDQFRRIVDALDAKGFWQSSTVIYTADHGEEFGEHGGTAHGKTVYDEQLRVPLVMKLPLGEAGGTRRPDPVTLADVVPTLAEIHDLSKSEHWIGTSFWRHRIPPERPLYFTEDLDGYRLYGLRRGALKVIVQLYPSYSSTVFSLDRDPGEQNGVEMGCGVSSPADADLVGTLRSWRERDVAAYPSLRLGSRPEPTECKVAVDLAEISKPFLTAEHYCGWSDRINGSRLVFGGRTSATKPLYVSADDRGRQAPVLPLPGEAACSVVYVEKRLMEGAISEEHLRQLQALGYLEGS
jgi:arylsulfatase A-like enzyme